LSKTLPSIILYLQCLFRRGEIKVASGWQGRNALGPIDVGPVYERHKAQEGAILHEKRTLTEEPFMEIFIAADPDGYELCLITRKFFIWLYNGLDDQFGVEAASATDFKGTFWHVLR
jgi:hypothetical protein